MPPFDVLDCPSATPPAIRLTMRVMHIMQIMHISLPGNSGRASGDWVQSNRRTCAGVKDFLRARA